jgi:hypothetical protein
MAAFAPRLHLSLKKPAKLGRIWHFGRMEPMHRAAALDSKGMAAAVTRGPR